MNRLSPSASASSVPAASSVWPELRYIQPVLSSLLPTYGSFAGDFNASTAATMSRSPVVLSHCAAATTHSDTC